MFSRTRQRQYDNIIKNAKELFIIKGIQDTSMNDIAQQADIERKTIYNYFETKKELATAVIIGLPELDRFYYLGETENEAQATGYEMMTHVIEVWADEYMRYRDVLRLEWQYEMSFKKIVLLMKEEAQPNYIEKTPMGRSIIKGIMDKTIYHGKMDWLMLFFTVIKCLKIVTQKKLFNGYDRDDCRVYPSTEEALSIILRGLKN